MSDVPVCGDCGQKHVRSGGAPSCAGHSRGRLRPEIAGKPCRAIPMRGQRVCRLHGGAAPQAKAAAEVRIVQANIATLAASLTEPIEGEDQDPADIVAESIRLHYRLCAWFWQRVCALEPRAFIWGKTKEKIGGDDGGITFEPKAHAWYVLWRDAVRERDRLCLEAIKAGFEERRVRMAEREADRFVTLLDQVLAAFGHDPEDPQVAQTVERLLRAA